MALQIYDSTTGTTTATLPVGSASGDMVAVWAYRSLSATAPTLPASWTSIHARAVSPAILVAYRVYDGAWTMPTFTNATRCHAVGIRGQAASPVGANNTAGGTVQNIPWAALTLNVADGTSIVVRGAVHERPDQVIATAASHTLREAEGTQPGQITQSLGPTATASAATSNTLRSDVYSVSQVEVLAAAVAAVVGRIAMAPYRGA